MSTMESIEVEKVFDKVMEVKRTPIYALNIWKLYELKNELRKKYTLKETVDILRKYLSCFISTNKLVERENRLLEEVEPGKPFTGRIKLDFLQVYMKIQAAPESTLKSLLSRYHTTPYRSLSGTCYGFIVKSLDELERLISDFHGIAERIVLTNGKFSGKLACRYVNIIKAGIRYPTDTFGSGRIQMHLKYKYCTVWAGVMKSGRFLVMPVYTEEDARTVMGYVEHRLREMGALA